MILVTGGSGFIGSHTVRALHELGENSLLVQRRTHHAPAHLADLPVAVAQGDVTDLASLLEAGRCYDITGIVHLAGYDAWLPEPGPAVPATRKALDGLLNVVEAAQQWEVPRISVASTIGVYSGASPGGPLREDMPVLLSAPHPIPRSKKINELLTEQLAETTGIEILNLRISGTWGPLGHDDPFFAAPALLHAAAHGTAPELSGLLAAPHAEDALETFATSRTPAGPSPSCSSRTSSATAPTTSPPAALPPTPTSSGRSGPRHRTPTCRCPTPRRHPRATSTSAASPTTPVTAPSTTQNGPPPTTSPGCAPATRGSSRPRPEDEQQHSPCQNARGKVRSAPTRCPAERTS